jgi:hypothetical protein
MHEPMYIKHLYNLNPLVPNPGWLSCSVTLTKPNVSHCKRPIMATLTQPPFKFWSASEHSGHLFMVLKGEDFKVNLLHIFGIR